MKGFSFIAAAAAPLGALAVCTSSQNYVTLPNFVEPNACIPSGYGRTADLGQTNPTDLQTRCQAQCTSLGQDCAAYVGQLFKAADSNLYSGQCFFYPQTPAAPVRCVDHPTIMIGQQKDTIANCFSISSSSATKYCSSLLGIQTVTVYTRTTTPLATTTTVTSTSGTTTTTISDSTTLTVPTTTTSTSTITSIVTQVTTSLETSTVGTSTVYQKRQLTARAAAVPAPACVPTYEPIASLRSACSCLSIATPTVSRVSTAPTSTITTTVTSTTSFSETSRTTVTSLTTRTDTITTLSTTVLTTSTTTTTTTRVTPILVKPKICNARGLPGANAFNYDANFNTNQAACIASCKPDARCLATGFYIVTDPTTGTQTGTCRKYDKSVTDSADLGAGYYNFNDKNC